ncbi:MAG: hypothetical protein V4649_11785 [Bacteroidota bacterium]
MDKTVHIKLTAKPYKHTLTSVYVDLDNMVASLREEIAKDLLQPRPQAVANLLKMARGI